MRTSVAILSATFIAFLTQPERARGAAPSTAASSSGAATPDVAGSPAAATATAPSPSASAVGHSFAVEVTALDRVAACGSEATLPAHVDAALVAAHCEKLRDEITTFKSTWIDVAEPFIGKLLPATLPDKVVYPFGGGDLVGALATYPNAMEYTSISLEPVGDPRNIDTISRERLDKSLALARKDIHLLFLVAHSRTENMALATWDALPSQLVYALVGLAAHGLEPTDLRYFQLTPGGDLAYVTDADIAAADAKKGRERERALRDLFANMELTFRRRGGPAGEPVRVYRHIRWNLVNNELANHGELLTHLEKKGKVAIMTKAASYLLWSNDFTRIRDYIASHMTFMVSDSTGLPVHVARAAGFTQETFGTFVGPFLGSTRSREALDMKKMWQEQQPRELPFRYGYPDNDHHSHLLITKPG